MEQRTTFRRAMLRWHRHHARSFPWRETSDPYAILIGEVLLQRTRGEHIEAVYREVLRRWPTPETLALARASTIERVIRPIGLPHRADKIHRMARVIVDRGAIPREPVEIEKLPGVGPYGAHAVPIFAHNCNLPLVDWVIARVLRRYFGLPADRRPNADKDLWAHARWLVEPGRARDLWLGTLDFAAAICKPTPNCTGCPLSRTCRHAADTDDNGIPSSPRTIH